MNLHILGFALMTTGYVSGTAIAAWLSYHNHEHDAVILWRTSALVTLLGIGLLLS